MTNTPMADALVELFDLSDEQDECWVLRNKVSQGEISCLALLGGRFGGKPDATPWIIEMCCLPCRLRAIVQNIKEASNG